MVRFEWDDDKDAENLQIHGVSFDVARGVFDDPLSVTMEYQIVDGEQRYVTIGCLEGRLLLLVVHTDRAQAGEEDEEVIRIISARVPTRQERKRYEEGD
jgi:uncharacterized protein